MRGQATSLLVALLVGCDTTGSRHTSPDASAGSPIDAAGNGGSGSPGSGGRGSGGTPGSGGSAPANGGLASKGGAGGVMSAGGSKSGGGRASMGGAGTGGTVSGKGGAQSGGTTSTGGADTADSGDAYYTTNFDLTESPLSENGAWHNDGLDWTKVESGSGNAFGTQPLGVMRSGPGQYNDSYAYLSGFPADQQASAVVHRGTIDTGCTHEVEILLRWADSAHVARGYECNVAFDGSYAQIVRWNGAVGDYTYLNSGGSVPGGVQDGDTVSASVVGDQITLSVNGVVRSTARDSTFPTGNPGIGLWRGSNGCGTKGDFGFTSFTARAAP